jgi:hypothetical protein
VASMTQELQGAATRSAYGRPGCAVPFVNLGVGGSAGPARTRANGDRELRVAARREGNRVKATASSNELKG